MEQLQAAHAAAVIAAIVPPSAPPNKRPAKQQVSKILSLIGLFGGAEEDRTPDLRIANATLSQLSYGPFSLKYRADDG